MIFLLKFGRISVFTVHGNEAGIEDLRLFSGSGGKENCGSKKTRNRLNLNVNEMQD